MDNKRVVSRVKATSVQELSEKERDMVGGGIHYTSPHVTSDPTSGNDSQDPGGLDAGF